MSNNKLGVVAGVVALLVIVAITAFLMAPTKPTNRTPSTTEQAPAASSEAEKQARTEIRAVQGRFQKAVREKDMPSVLSLLTVDFIQQPLSGPTINRDQAEAAMKASWPRVRSIEEWDLKLVDLKLEQDRAVGIVQERIVARIADGNGRVERQETNSRSRNTWVRTPSGWKYRRMVELRPGEGALGNPEYMTQDQWAKRSNEAQAQNRKKSAARDDQSAATSDAKPLTPAQARAMLEATYSDFRAAVRKKDVDAALATLTDDYVVEYPTHNQPRLAIEAAVRKDLKNTISIPEWTQTFRNIKVDGNVVYVDVNERKTTVVKGQNGTQQRGTMNTTMRDTWVRTRQGWKNRRTEMKGLTITAGGQTRKVF